MKRKFLSILFALVLVLSLSLVTAVPAGAAPVTLTVAGDGEGGFTLAHMDQHFSAETIDASADDTILTGSVTLGNFEAGAVLGNDVWYEIGLVSEATYLGYSWLHNKGIYMIAHWDTFYEPDGYMVHIQNVPGYDPQVTGNYLNDQDAYPNLGWDDAGLAWFTVPNATFDYEIKYHDVTVASGEVDLRITIDNGTTWSGWKHYKYAENDEWTIPVPTNPRYTEQAAIDGGYATDDDLTNARIVSQIFVQSGTTETFTAAYDNIQVNGTPYVLAPRVLNVDTGKGYTAIQLAIDAPETDANDLISVAAGTYNEAVIIDKSLTLNGAKPDVDARTRDTTSGESILDGAGVALDVGEGAFNIADGVSNVIIDGFEVCNYSGSSNPGNGTAFMAYCYDTQTEGRSNITIQNNYMHDLGWNGILVWSNNQVVQDDFTIQYNLIEKAPYAGIELTNVINSRVLNNKIIAPTVLAPDPGDAGVGIEVAVRAYPRFTITAGTDVLVEGNEISGAFAKDSRAAINILSRTYSSTSEATLTGVTLKGNTVSASVDVAILAVADESREGTATISNLQIVDDNIVSNFTKGGIVVKDVLSVQIEGNIISTTDHSAAPNGIQVGYVMDPTATTGTVKGNQVSGCHWEEYDPTLPYEYTEGIEPGDFTNWTGSGILVIAPNSALEISDNEVQSCDVGLDIEAGSGTLITNNNDVHDNSYGFVFWNADPTINFNNISGNSLFGVYRTSDGDPAGILDAENNWWNHSSGPGGEGNGSGDTVGAGIDYEPWLLTVEGLTDEKLRYDKTLSLPADWSIVSPDAELDFWVSVDAEELMYAYDGGGFTTSFILDPVTPIFIRAGVFGGGIGFDYAASSQGIFTTDLEAGWNLIGIPKTFATAEAVLSPIRLGANNEVALATLASQGNYNPSGETFYESMLNPLNAPPTLYPFDGYWAYMNVAKEFGVVVVPVIPDGAK